MTQKNIDLKTMIRLAAAEDSEFRARLSPEKALILACVSRAVADALPNWSTKYYKQTEYRTTARVRMRHSLNNFGSLVFDAYLARIWILGTSDPGEPYSFEWCCDALGFDHNLIGELRRNIAANVEANVHKMFEFIQGE